jgi:hypothetical protein
MAHETFTRLREKLAAVSGELPINSQWEHFKTHGRYRITGHVILEASSDVAVLYCPLAAQDVIFARSAQQWQEEILVDGVPTLRFRQAYPDDLQVRE